MRNWQFDKKNLEQIIRQGYILLENPEISRNQRNDIITDINTFTSFLYDEYENQTEFIPKPPKDIERLKRYTLSRMKKQYQSLGTSLINWIMDLYNTDIFQFENAEQKNNMGIDEQAELTLENYSKNSKKTYKPALKLIKNTKTPQIQQVLSLYSSSYCYHNSITNKPYLIINPTTDPWIFNHEVEHAVETTTQKYIHPLYPELGPIFFELLFNDILYNHQGFLNKGDYSERITECRYELNSLYRYLYAMQVFAKDSFVVSTEKFKQTFMEITGISEENICTYIREEAVPSDKEEDLQYLLAYLKGIELRERARSKKEDCSDLLSTYLNSQTLNFTPTPEKFNIYKAYVNEMKSKTKTKI